MEFNNSSGSEYTNYSHNDTDNVSTRGFTHVDLSYIPIAYFINRYLIPPTCAAGAVGNFLTVIVLTQRQFRKSVSDLGRSSHTGLIVLALLDFMYCLLFLPNFAWPERYRKEKLLPFHPERDFWFYRQIYIKALSGVFVTGSTLMTVNVALGRYIAVCHPMKARQILQPTRIRSGIVVSVVCAVLLNIPRFFARKGFRFGAYYWIGGTKFLYSESNHTFEYMHAVVGLFLPVLILLFCNFKLSHALHRSVLLRRHSASCHDPDARSRRQNRLTLTLVVIICVYLLGVAPLSLLNFTTDVITNNTSTRDGHYYKQMTNIRIAAVILNLGEALALSLNFLLYCAVNMYFRRCLKNAAMLALCRCPRQYAAGDSSLVYKTSRLGTSHV